jgi:hypothetical protein
MTLETLRAELDALKRMNRRLVLAVGALGLVLAGALSARTIAQDRPQTIQARSFVLVDDNGNVRARLETDARGSARLSFFNADGSEGLVLYGDRQVFPVK